MNYTICPTCGYKLLKSGDSSNIEGYCPKCTEKMTTEIKDGKSKILTILSRVLALLAIFALVGLTACSSSGGFPNGTYYPSNEKGEISNQGLEYAWQIKKDKAEYLYAEYDIVKKDEYIFFDRKSTDNVMISYEVQYGKKTKILTLSCMKDGITTTTYYKK